MRKRGPSPLGPSLIVGVLGFLIFGPTLLSIIEYVLTLFRAIVEGSGTFVIVLLLLVHWLSTFFPTLRFSSSPAIYRQTSSSGFDSDGFGFGSILLLVLFFVLYNIM
ncbi:Small rna degrading nuclease 3 [Melia azedarach]|uniref:Small rna degrading nuclease 3 n=1 Tax=Melia azedarach TaxID=155640 RepID=A0ACC1YEI0_MELAZ|nr:Small rna degrading nuclease 3 [Melia azedarach]